MSLLFANRKFTLEDLGQYVAVLVKHARMMLLIMVFSLCLGLAYFVYAKPIYYAKGLIGVRSQARLVDTESVYKDSDFRTVSRHMQAPHIVERVCARFGIHASAATIREKHLIKFRIRNNSEGNMIVEVWPTSVALAEGWTENLLDVYLGYRDDLRREKRQAIIDSYTEDMLQVRDRSERNHARSSSYREQMRLVETGIEYGDVSSVPRQVNVIKKQLAAIDRVLEFLGDEDLDVTARLALLSAELGKARVSVGQVVETPKAREAEDGEDRESSEREPTIVVPAMVDALTDNWDKLERRQRELQATLAKLNRRYLAGHPQVVEVTKELAQIDEDLANELMIAASRIKLEHAHLAEEKRQLEERLPDYYDVSEEYARIQREVARFDANHIGWEKMYKRMARELELLDFGANKERMDLEYLGLLQLNDVPVSPNRLRLAVVFSAFGIFLALGAAFVSEYVDHTVAVPEQAESLLKLRGLGVIPLIPLVEESNWAAVYKAENVSLREAFRNLRTNIIEHRDLPAERSVLLVTSTSPEEGKSMVSFNLAIAFALLGERVLLLDADLHRGMLHRTLDIPSAPGLVGLVRGRASLDDACVPTAVPNLDLLPAGDRYGRNISELVSAEELSRLVDRLRGRYKRVIIDTPPVLGLSDTSALTRIVDGVLFVIRSRSTPLAHARSAVKLLTENGGTIFGCVINRLDLRDAMNYYYQRYYSEGYYARYHRSLTAAATVETVEPSPGA